MKGFKKLLQTAFGKNLAITAKATASSFRGDSDAFAPALVLDGNPDTYWATNDGEKTGSLEINFAQPTEIKYIVLQEYIQLGQRVKAFSIEVMQGEQWKKIAEATTIGYKRILKIDPVTADRIRVVITDSKACPVLANLELY